MELHIALNKLRTEAHLTQEKFAEIMGVSQQSVQKWESGASTPDLEKLIFISKYFDVSLDTLIIGANGRIIEERHRKKALTPQYQNMHEWEIYCANLPIEYAQSIEEGLDIDAYKEVFHSISKLPLGDTKKKLADILFDVVSTSPLKTNYQYTEPSNLDQIKALRQPYEYKQKDNGRTLKNKIHGAWLGRTCGCMLGKTVEGIKSNEFIPFLKQTENYPLKRYIYKSDITDEIMGKYSFPFASRDYADCINGMPFDDDTNYTVLSQYIIERFGRDFTPMDVSQVWMGMQSKHSYCTAERVAYINFINGFAPPQSAMYKNPYREWIGAQIRGDYFGYINPGNPELAAEMAYKDASISHIKNGIYGEMFIAAMLAIAAVTDDIMDIILGGLAQIPSTSRLYESVHQILKLYNNGATMGDCIVAVKEKYDENTIHGWCHTISNAMIVTAALLYGKGDYAKSICLAVQACFDTDCNGATVGSIIGMAYGVESIPECWYKPIDNTIRTTLFGYEKVKITDMVEKTLSHIKK